MVDKPLVLMIDEVDSAPNSMVVANRIFETRLYNYYLSEADMQEKDNAASLSDKSQFVISSEQGIYGQL